MLWSSQTNYRDYLRKEIQKNIKYESPSLIQQKAIPAILSGRYTLTLSIYCLLTSLLHRDVLMSAASGSGKTAGRIIYSWSVLNYIAAYLIPIMDNLNIELSCQVLILVPTRELAQQIEGVSDPVVYICALT